jgi:hypothetical protein
MINRDDLKKSKKGKGANEPEKITKAIVLLRIKIGSSKTRYDKCRNGADRGNVGIHLFT